MATEQVLKYNSYYKNKHVAFKTDDAPVIKNATQLQSQSDPRGIIRTNGLKIISEVAHQASDSKTIQHVNSDGKKPVNRAERAEKVNLSVNMANYDRSKPLHSELNKLLD